MMSFLKLIDHLGCTVKLNITQLPSPGQEPYRGEAITGSSYRSEGITWEQLIRRPRGLSAIPGSSNTVGLGEQVECRRPVQLRALSIDHGYPLDL